MDNLDSKDQNSVEFETTLTKRATVSAMEKILYQPIKVLDHGFIRVIDYMGDDNAIVQAARVSYGRGTKQTTQDKGLIRYLLRHRHTTPFEMCDIKFHIKLPIFVARQWIRHRTASLNEYSARYSVLGNEFYTPQIEHLTPQSKINKQGRSEQVLPQERAEELLRILKDDAANAYQNYTYLMNEDEYGKVINEDKIGIARELARMNLNLSFYTEWYWKLNLHNLLHFLALRADSHAQYEIRVYADEILKIVQKWVPLTFEAYEEYRIHGASISRSGVQVIKRMIAGESVDLANSGMSKREWEELMKVFKEA